jgi:hypothetical protein
MLNQTSPRVLFVVFSLAVLILSPVIIAFLPIGVVETMYHDSDNILLLIPLRNFILVTSAMASVIVMLLLLAWKRRIFTYALAALLVIASGVMVYYSTLSYTAIQNGGLVFKEYHTVKEYAWSDIAEIVYEYDTNSPGVYTFTTTKGETLQIQKNGQFGPAEQSAIYQAAMRQGISFIEREKGSE